MYVINIKEQAKQYYLAGMKVQDIAEKLGKSPSIVRSWKSRYRWEDDFIADKAPPKSVVTKRNKNSTQRENGATSHVAEPAVNVLADSDLTDKQKAFVVAFLILANAT